jgi:anti-anti-sigma regulatory factor
MRWRLLVTTIKSAVEPAPDSDVIGRSDLGPPAQPATPGATVEVRHVDAAGGVIIRVTGVVGRNDAEVLSKQLHTELDAGPTVLVVNLVGVQSCDQAGREAIALARERAHAEGVALHVVDPDELAAGGSQGLVRARRVTDRRRTLR